MTNEQTRQRAQADYANNQQVQANHEAMGMTAPAVCSLTVAEIEAQYIERSAADRERSDRRFKTRAGYRALCSKYGETAAKNIIAKAKAEAN